MRYMLSVRPGNRRTVIVGEVLVLLAAAVVLVLANYSGAQALSTPSDTDSPLRRVSVSSTAAGANDSSTDASTSADGRYVAFESGATNLVPVVHEQS